jgi:hypothetical protein
MSKVCFLAQAAAEGASVHEASNCNSGWCFLQDEATKYKHHMQSSKLQDKLVVLRRSLNIWHFAGNFQICLLF